MAAASAVFNFVEFARETYADPKRPAVGEDKFVLPAFYGGVREDEASDKFKALVVLEAPSVPYTRRRWNTPCATLQEAIGRHREIFFEWAFDTKKGRQAELFRILVGEPRTARDFFRLLYVTDIWKDGAFKDKRKRDNLGYGRYWRSKLEVEIRSVSAERVIFVGRAARAAGYIFVPSATPVSAVAFPNRSSKDLDRDLRQLRADVRGAA